MTDKLKKMAIAGLFTGLAFSFCVTAFSNSAMISARAADFVGNHYTAREATFSTSGCCEYWISCITHEIFFNKPVGQITEAGVAFVSVDENDPRYLAPTAASITPTSLEISGTNIVDSQEGQITNNDGTITVIDNNGNDTGLILSDQNSSDNYDIIGYIGDSKTIIIPEGTTSLYSWRSVFDANANPNVNQVETIIVPTTIETLQPYAFNNLPNLKTLVIKSNKIEWGCVVNCPKLKTIYLFDSVMSVAQQAFNNYSTQSQTDPNNIEIYCQDTKEAALKKWSSDWNRLSWGTNKDFLTVFYDAEF